MWMWEKQRDKRTVTRRFHNH